MTLYKIVSKNTLEKNVPQLVHQMRLPIVLQQILNLNVIKYAHQWTSPISSHPKSRRDVT